MRGRRLLCLAAASCSSAAALASSACRLLLVRHGETNFNADGRIQGTLDSSTVRTIGTNIVSYSSSDATVAGLEGANRVSAEGLTGTGAARQGRQLNGS